ncbi:iron-containing alcohol dehydrogenase family protein [soil metagenome]
MPASRHLVAELRLFDGTGCLSSLNDELKRLSAERAVVVCGASIVDRAATLDALKSAIASRLAGVIPLAKAHSPLPSVQAIAHELGRLQADAVIAIGGGSAMVSARAASILLAEGGDITALSTRRDASGTLASPRLAAAKLPQLVVPTTPTTAAVKAGSAVLDPAGGQRLALFDPKTRAKAVFVHPDFLATAPARLVVSASLNTLTMACEGLMSRTTDALSDGLLLHALRLLFAHLPAVGAGDDRLARHELMLASLMTGQATDYTGAGLTIPLAHAVSAHAQVDNGIANAILLPHVMAFNAGSAASGLDKIAMAVGHGTEPFVRLSRACDVPQRLRDVGVARDALPGLATVAMDDWFIRDNPRRIEHASELERVLEAAW